MENEKKPMTGEEVLEIIKSLSRSQGFYGRLYEGYMQAKEEDPEYYEKALAELEAEKFTDVLQIVWYYECGKHNARVFWRVSVTYEMYGSIEVEAESAAEAYRMVAKNPEKFGLPDESFYVNGSLHVEPADEESAIAMIEAMSDNGQED